MKAIAVVGTGFMGPSIAQVFALKGHSVRLYGRTADKFDSARKRIRANIELMADYELAEKSDGEAVLSRITMTTNLERACVDADLVLETVVEDLSVKQELFAKLDRFCEPSTILSSNTSVLSITEIASKSVHKERIIGTHFYQPAHLVPLVEVIRTKESLESHVDEVFRLLAECGKTPVHVLKDIPGFIANRMQHALWREAFALIDEGVCDPETIDVAVSNSFGMRLPVLGPVANADLVGLDLINSIHTYILPKLNVSTEPASTLRDHVSLNELGFKTQKGFREWTDESMASTKYQLSTFLLEVLRLRKRWEQIDSGS